MDGWVRDCGGNVGKMLAMRTMDDRLLRVPVHRPPSMVILSIVWLKYSNVLPSIFLIQVTAPFAPVVESAS